MVRTREPRAEVGFSLIELLIASTISLLVVGGVLLMLQNLQDVHRNSQELIEAQQTARISLEQVQRDMYAAGVGLTPLLSPLPGVVPRVGGGVDIRYNQGGLTASLVSDMSNASSHLFVDDVTGFETDMMVAVYDATGTLDIVKITIVHNGTHFHHDGASKAYKVADGTVVARVLTISYWVQTTGGIDTLVRQEDGGSAQPLAENLKTFDVVYYNELVPPQQFVPVSVADQMRIRIVKVTIEVETENIRLNTNQKQTVTLSTRVTPRATMLSQ